MFHDDKSYTQFCGLSNYNDKMFFKETFNRTCNWNARRAVKPAMYQKTDFALIEIKSGRPITGERSLPKIKVATYYQFVWLTQLLPLRGPCYVVFLGNTLNSYSASLTQL